MLERQIRDARALDTEALCITPGRHVWSLRCDVHILGDAGNLIDASALAAIGAFLHFRRSEISIDNGVVTVHPHYERAATALAIHHIPVCISYALFRDPKRAASSLLLSAGTPTPTTAARSTRRAPSRTLDDAIAVGGGGLGSLPDDAIPLEDEVMVLDSTDREELVCDGTVSFVMNAHRELCGIHKLGGCPVAASALVLAARVAGLRAVQLVRALKESLVAAEGGELEKQKARHAAAAGVPLDGILDTAVAVPSQAAAAAVREKAAETTGMVFEAADGYESSDEVVVAEEGGE